MVEKRQETDTSKQLEYRELRLGRRASHHLFLSHSDCHTSFNKLKVVENVSVPLPKDVLHFSKSRIIGGSMRAHVSQFAKDDVENSLVMELVVLEPSQSPHTFRGLLITKTYCGSRNAAAVLYQPSEIKCGHLEGKNRWSKLRHTPQSQIPKSLMTTTMKSHRSLRQRQQQERPHPHPALDFPGYSSRS